MNRDDIPIPGSRVPDPDEFPDGVRDSIVAVRARAGLIPKVAWRLRQATGAPGPALPACDEMQFTGR